ncbi:MAG TPA: DAK2 domain-containing protein [Candidatus Dormibacteraeota bacterium]|nr:DAK2 domain-containing protein [Candidatus Dormibacteraeota bacterium]
MGGAEAGAHQHGSLTVERKPLLDVDGHQLALGLRSALAWLQANQEAVNDLNVFPVPDGDTGSNMYLTLRSAVEDVQHLVDPSSAATVMQAAARGSLMGARGNSGVILSQVLRGFSQGLGHRTRVDAAGIAAAFQEASAVAYKAVMKPTEGTILTVVRESAAAARRAADSSKDLREVLDEVVSEAHAAVQRTPDQLAVLRDAGVVDAGGFGYAVILEGFARALDEVNQPRPITPAQVATPGRASEPQLRSPEDEVRAPAIIEGRTGAAAVAEKKEGWGYCTEFLITGPGLDFEGLRSELSALGDSSLVVGDADLVRVHIHTHDPATLIGAASRRGTLSRLKVEDMSAQHHEVLERAADEEARTGRPAQAVKPATSARKPLGVVTVALGEGFRSILEGLGADRVVAGGQTMNPSIEDLLNAAREVNASSVIILPNNSNVILTAEQVDELAPDVDVRVVPTRNLPQGISALLALDPEAPLDGNCDRMREAAGAVTSVEVTRAVRDSVSNGKRIRSGQVIALVDDEIAEVGDDNLAVVDAVLRKRDAEPELITVYRGAEVDDAEATRFVSALGERHPSVEFEVHEGGQEHYPYILSVE